ncbi:transcriptional regulator [Enterobacterales bacterium]|nr:transcriptional regulator [Enterobacterales bacterium]
MSITNLAVKPSLSTKRPYQNWHTADIIAALHKKGTTLAALSRESGLSSSTLANALSRPWPKGELLIAQALGTKPSDIWPLRYFTENGQPIVKTMRNTTKV